MRIRPRPVVWVAAFSVATLCGVTACGSTSRVDTAAAARASGSADGASPIAASAPPPEPTLPLEAPVPRVSLRALPSAPDAALFAELASGNRPLTDIVDARRGVVILRDKNLPCFENCPVQDEVLCGAQLDDEVAWLISHAGRTPPEPADPIVSCKGMTCTKQPRGEWDPAEEYVFVAKKGGGVTLASIAQVDTLLRDQATVEADWATVPGRLKNLAGKSCP